jgi:hypothetical protein
MSDYLNKDLFDVVVVVVVVVAGGVVHLDYYWTFDYYYN